MSPAPLLFPSNLRLTPEQFEQFCQASALAVQELTADGRLIDMEPTGGETGAWSLRLGRLLLAWADGPGDEAWVAFDSTTGLQLADNLMVRHDLSLLRRELAGPQHRTTPPLPASLPRSGAGAGQPQERAVQTWRDGQQGMAERLAPDQQDIWVV